MGWISTIIVGALTGWLASIIVKTNDQMGCLWNIAIGIAGAALGRWLAAVAFGYRLGDGFTFTGFLFGLGGAVLLIIVLRAIGLFRRGR